MMAKYLFPLRNLTLPWRMGGRGMTLLLSFFRFKHKRDAPADRQGWANGWDPASATVWSLSFIAQYSPPIAAVGLFFASHCGNLTNSPGRRVARVEASGALRRADQIMTTSRTARQVPGGARGVHPGSSAQDKP